MKIIPAYLKTEKNTMHLTADNIRHCWSDYTVPKTYNEYRTVSLDGAVVVKRGVILTEEHKALVYTAYRQAATEKQQPRLTVKQAAEIVKAVRRRRLALPVTSCMQCTYTTDDTAETKRTAEQKKRKKEVLERLSDKKVPTTAEQAEKTRQHSAWIGKVGQCKDDLTAAVQKYSKVEYTWDMLTNDKSGRAMIDLCKIITYCSCKKSVEREGTKTQYAMYYSCLRGEWDQPDVADVLSVAALAMYKTLTADSRQLEIDVHFLEKSADLLKHLNSVYDRIETNGVVKACKHYCADVSEDYHTNKRLANVRRWMLKAVTEKSVDSLIHAVFLAINDYLISIRSIHVSDNFVVSSIDSDYDFYCDIPDEKQDLDLLFYDVDKREKRKAILTAYHKVKTILSKSENTTLKLLVKGYTVTQIAYKRKITKQCASNHLCTIRAAFSRLITADPVLYAALDDCIIIDTVSDSKTDLTKTAEKKTNRQVEIDKIRTSMTEGLKEGIKEQIICTLDDFSTQVYTGLLSGKTIRQTAETLRKSKTTIGRVQTAIIKSVFDTIEYECKMAVNRDLFAKITLSELMKIFD
jgi:hypothetical protein